MTGALAGGQDSGGDRCKDEVFGRASGALLPVQKKRTVAVSDAGCGVDPKLGDGPVDPVGRPFELDVVADGRLVDNQMGGALGIVRPLGAELFVSEDGSVAELLEDLRERRAVSDGGLGLDADLVARGVDGGLVGLALVGDGTEVAVLADAKELFFYAEIAVGCVVESVVLEGCLLYTSDAADDLLCVDL